MIGSLKRLITFFEVMRGQNKYTKQARDWVKHQEFLATVQAISQKAMYRADDRLSEASMTLTDIGLLTYESRTKPPKLQRDTPITPETGWLRPFVELHSPRRQAVNLQLAIVDGHGDAVFESPATGQLLKRGKTRIISDNWLPMAGVTSNREGRWSVALVINGQLMALHYVRWDVVDSGQILSNLTSDGEIDKALQNAVTQGEFRPMSLDELLMDQKD